MFCRHCGQQIADTAVFCPYCGGENARAQQAAPQQQSPRFCRSCGQPMSAAAAFCPRCGTAAEQTASAAPRQAVPQQQAPRQSVPQQAAPRQTAAAAPRKAAPAAAPAAKKAASGAARKAAAGAARKGAAGKVVAWALAAAVVVGGGKMILDGLEDEPPANTTPPYTQNTVNPGGSTVQPGGSTTYMGLSGAPQQAVADGVAAGLTTEQAAGQEVYFVLQTVAYPTAEYDAEYDSDFVYVKVDERNGKAYLMRDKDDDPADYTAMNYDVSTGAISFSGSEDGDTMQFTLTRGADGAYTGVATGTSDGDSVSTYVKLSRITPTQDGRWLAVETGEIFSTDDLGYLEDTKIGAKFLAEAGVTYDQLHPSAPASQTPTYNPSTPSTYQGPVELSPELIDYYVMVEGQNRIREMYGFTVSHVTLPRTNSITEAEFEARVQEYVRAWGPNPSANP